MSLVWMDQVMRESFVCLVKDFRALLGRPSFYHGIISSIRKSVAEFRTYPGKFHDEGDVLTLKCEHQLNSYLKRYRFSDDLYSKDELEALTFQKFIETQKRVSVGFDVNDPRIFPVLKRARHHAKRILGKFDEKEWVEVSGRFGTRASVGSSREHGAIHDKLLSPLSASPKMWEWFVRTFSGTLLETAICKLNGLKNFRAPRMHEPTLSFTLTFVDKTFKALRAIQANTTIGTLYDSAIDFLMRERLAAEGLPLNKLQAWHGELARIASLTRHLVTLDLSSASDSVTYQLVMSVIPRDWWAVLKFGRIRKFGYSNRVYHTETFGGMGINTVFPLQTLIYYCLIRAVEDLTASQCGRVSVYGDDCIYPRRLHTVLTQVFHLLGLRVNHDKTFCHTNFRESCGSDYYRGASVRPYSFEGSDGEVQGNHSRSVAVLKLLNGLLTRWDRSEIPTTVFYLERVLCNTADTIPLVPPSFPVFSGIRVNNPQQPFPWYFPVSRPKWVFCAIDGVRNDNGWWSFLAFTAKTRNVGLATLQHYPNLWDSLYRPLREARQERPWRFWDVALPRVVVQSLEWKDLKKSYYSSLVQARIHKAVLTCKKPQIGFRKVRTQTPEWSCIV